MIARGLVLLVAGLVLLIDDDHAEVWYRREDGRAGADDDLGPAHGDLLPVSMSLRRGEPAVQNGNTGESRGEPADGLRRQRDLGDQHDRTPPLLDHFADALQVNFG